MGQAKQRGTLEERAEKAKEGRILKHFEVDETVVANYGPWESYKEGMDYVFSVQKGLDGIPELNELHEGIEDLSEYYEAAGIDRVEASNYISSLLVQFFNGNEPEIKLPRLEEHNMLKLKALLAKLIGIVQNPRLKRELYRYFD